MSAPRCDRCEAEMHPEVGHALGSETVLLWWRCEAEPRHVGRAIVLPEPLAAVAMGYHSGQ